MNIRVYLVILFCLVFESYNAYATDTDSLKSVKIQQQIVECVQLLNEDANTSDFYFKEAKVTAKKLIHLTSQYEQLTNDSMVRVCTFMGESFLAIAYNSNKELDSAFVHAEIALSLYNPYGKILCDTDFSNTFYKTIYGCDGIWGIVRDMYVKQHNIPKALEICCLINDSCSFRQLEVELIQSYTRQGEIYELVGDYENAIKCHISAFNKRLTLSNPGEYPLASQICNGIFEIIRRFYAKQKLSINNESLKLSFANLNSSSYLNDFFTSLSFSFCNEEEKIGETFWICVLFNTYIYLLEDFKQYDTIFSIEKGLEDFYSRNYRKGSIEYAEFLYLYKNIYSKYAEQLDSNVDKNQFIDIAEERERQALEMWRHFFDDNPINTFVVRYRHYQGTLTEEVARLHKILTSFVRYMSHSFSHSMGLNDFEKAQKAVLDMIDISENVLENFDATPYSMLGTVSIMKKDYPKAEKYFSKSYFIASELQDTIKMADANLWLYRIHNCLNYRAKAEQKLLEAYNLMTKYSLHSIEKSDILKEMANIYSHINNHELAYQLTLQSDLEKIHNGYNLSDDDYIKRAEMMYNPLIYDSLLLCHIQGIAEKDAFTRNIQKASELMGIHYIVSLMDFEKGISSYQKAANIAHELKDFVSEAKNIAEIGTILFACKRYDDALTYMQRAEKINPRFKYRELLSLMAYIHNDGIVKERLPYLYKITTTELKRKMLSVNTVGRERMVNFMPYDVFKSMPYYYPNIPECAEIAYNSTLLYKGLLQNTQKTISEYIANSNDTTLKSKYLRLQALNNFVPTGSKITVESEAQQQIEIINLELSILKSLSQKAVLSDLEITWDKIRKKLKSNDIAIEFVEINKLEPLDRSAFYYGALILKKNFKHPIFVELCPKSAIDNNVNVLLHSFNSGSRLTSSKWKSISEQLYADIWGKLKDYIHPGDNIYFSAAGMLHQAPIEVLSCSDNILANEKYNIYRLSSTRELCKKKERHFTSVVLYGGLIYESSEEIQQDYQQYNGSVSPTDFLSRTGWDYLPSTAIEVKQIASQLDTLELSITVYEGKDGTEKSFRKLSGKDMSILHIATHGFFFNNKDLYTQNYYINSSQSLDYLSPMKRTGLMMSGGQSTWLGTASLEEDNNGVLLADEIASLDLSHTNLVVLSACQTGLGDIDERGEGVFGIQRAFKLAGVNSILMTLGKVDDKATQLFMDCFYKQLINGENINKAFHYAQNYVRNYEYENNGAKMDYKNPRFWAPFILLDGIN